MKILIACEFSGIVRDAFTAKGHNVTSCDILPSDALGKHYLGDVRDILYDQWDLIIAHPPCTYITNSGVRWLHSDSTRWEKLDDACEFFNLFLDHPCSKVVIENPIPHKYALERFTNNKKYDQMIQPYLFGHPESKRTCFWLKGLPELKETNDVKHIFDKLSKKEKNRVHYLPPSADRSKLRSTTYLGIALAMADQWGVK